MIVPAKRTTRACCGLRARLGLLAAVMGISGCAAVGPEYRQPESPLAPDWYDAEVDGLTLTVEQQVRWWELLNDPALNRLIAAARADNNTLEAAGLRVLEARAQAGIAQGSRFPQTQVVAGSAAAVSASENAANTAAGDLEFEQFDLGVAVAWELDFWGRYRRAIDAAEASFQASIASYDQAMVLLAAQVASTYIAIRTLEEQLEITRQNIAVQERSYEIVDVQFKNGNTSELDVLQARSLLLSTQASVPALESQLKQAKNALSILLGKVPASVDESLSGPAGIPVPPDALPVGVPADLLRQRPDIRQSEALAMAANAGVGLATADLYPSFSLSGTVGLVAAGSTNTTRTGDDGFGELFSADSLTYSAGPGFVWPFLNYGRIKNNIRVQDTRLQQALVGYRETVIRAAAEVEDAFAALDGTRRQDVILAETVRVAERANEVALVRFREGFADYQRVLDAQQLLFAQQSRYVSNRGNIANSFVQLYLALGGGWQTRFDEVLLRDRTRQDLVERTDWGTTIETTEAEAGSSPQ